MPDKSVFWLIRHAEPDTGPGGRVCLGQKLDVPLSPRGLAQAEALAERLRDVPFDAIYVSPLLRARQTAGALRQACPRVIAPELIEVSGGEWDGMPFSQIYERYPSFFDGSRGGDRTPPGGESDGEAFERVMGLMDRLSGGGGGTCALVTHSGLGRILLCRLMGLPPHRKRAIPMEYAGCSRIEHENGAWRVFLSGPLLDEHE